MTRGPVHIVNIVHTTNCTYSKWIYLLDCNTCQRQNEYYQTNPTYC